MLSNSDNCIRNRVTTALELCDLGEELVEQRLRREHPFADDEGVRQLVATWYTTRPGAAQGDAIGRPGIWPRATNRS
jgi:hypothetical protein